MKKIILGLCLMSILNQLYSQEKSRQFDYKVGSGISLAGKGNIIYCFENELCYKIDSYFSSSIYIDIGRSIGYTDELNDYLQGGCNFFISPFKNNKQNNFKIGLGLSLMNESFTEIGNIQDSGNYDKLYKITKVTKGAYNIIIEDEHRISSRFLIGGKLFTSNKFTKSGLLIGGIIKIGVLL